MIILRQGKISFLAFLNGTQDKLINNATLYFVAAPLSRFICPPGKRGYSCHSWGRWMDQPIWLGHQPPHLQPTWLCWSQPSLNSSRKTPENDSWVFHAKSLVKKKNSCGWQDGGIISRGSNDRSLFSYKTFHISLQSRKQCYFCVFHVRHQALKKFPHDKD